MRHLQTPRPVARTAAALQYTASLTMTLCRGTAATHASVNARRDDGDALVMTEPAAAPSATATAFEPQDSLTIACEHHFELAGLHHADGTLLDRRNVALARAAQGTAPWGARF